MKSDVCMQLFFAYNSRLENCLTSTTSKAVESQLHIHSDVKLHRVTVYTTQRFCPGML